MKTRSKNKTDPTELQDFQGIAGSIFSRLEMQDLMNCKLVCRTFNNFLSTERAPWVDLLKNYVAQYSEVLKTEKIPNENKWTQREKISEHWRKFLDLLYKDGELDDLMLISHKFMKTLNENKKYGKWQISKVFGGYSSVYKSIIHFEDLRLFQLFNRLKFTYVNEHADGWISDLFNKEFIDTLDTNEFDTLIDCLKEMTIDPCDGSRKIKIGYRWVKFEYYEALTRMMMMKDPYKVQRILELKNMKDPMYDDYDTNHNSSFPPLLRIAFEKRNLEIFKMVTGYLKTNFNAKIKEITGIHGIEYDEALRGFYPLHAAAWVSNFEIFEYVYSKVQHKFPKMYTKEKETILPYHLAEGKFREKAEKLYYKEICSRTPEDRKRSPRPYVPPVPQPNPWYAAENWMIFGLGGDNEMDTD